MLHIVTSFGEWKMNNGVAEEFVPTDFGNAFFVDDDIKYEDFLRMVCEGYSMINKMKAVKLAYILPKRILEKIPGITPPMTLNSDKNLADFITLLKTDPMRLNVSLTAKKGGLVRVNGAADFSSSGNVQYQTTKPSHETTKPSLETMKPSQLQKSETIKSGEIFSGKQDLIKKLRKLSVIERFDFSIKKSRKLLFYAKCFVPGCSWRIRAAAISKSNPEFQVRKYIDLHSCSATDRYARHRQANAECIGKMYVEQFSGGSDLRGIRPKHIMDCMRGAFSGLEIGYTKAHCALAYARDMVRGTPASGYQDLPSYLYKIREANPGTIVELEQDDVQRFMYLFIAFGACIKGFPYMRRVIVVDAAHLNGKFRGMMLVAACQDGNRGIYPIAFGVVNAEDAKSWEWFFTQLRGVIGDGKDLAFISDRCAAIAKALTIVFPEANKGMCLYHLGQNMAGKFKKDPQVALAKQAARVCRPMDFDEIFEVIRRQNKDLHKYLEEADITMWARSYFPGDRYDIMTSNIAECINSVLKEDRAFPIVYFVDSIRKMLSRWFAERREKAASLKTKLTEEAELVLHMRHAKMSTLTVERIDSSRSHVTGGLINCMVDLEKRSCTCKEYDLDKLPCEHAIKVAQCRKIDEATLVDPCYTKEYLVAAYADPINPADEDLIVPADVLSQVCLPPKIEKQRGRPKMKRYLSAIEKAKRFKRKLLRKKNQTTTTSNPTPATKKGNNQSSRSTSTKKRGRSQAPSTPIKQKQTNRLRRTPSTNPSSRKKPKYSAKITAPSTPNPTVRKGLFQSSPASDKPSQCAKRKNSKKPTQGAKKQKSKKATLSQRRQPPMNEKRRYVCTKCKKGGHNRSTCKVATSLFG